MRTLDFIPSGSFVIEYVGFIRTEDEYEKLWNQYPGSPFYGMDLDDKWVIDTNKEENLCKFKISTNDTLYNYYFLCHVTHF